MCTTCNWHFIYQMVQEVDPNIEGSNLQTRKNWALNKP
jgi:hypothetical protein